MGTKETKNVNNVAKKVFGLLLPTKKAKIIASIIVIIIIVGIASFPFLNNSKAKVDTTLLINKLEESSELTTVKLNYKGFAKYEDEGVVLLNRANFSMLYKATARIGVDVKKVSVKADDVRRIVYVTIPKAEVQDVKVDASSIEYFDESFAIFNVNEKEDGNKAIALAEEAAKKEIHEMGGLQMADAQAATLVKGILANAIPDDYTIEVKEAE